MIEIIQQYKLLVGSMKELIDKSGFKPSYLADEIGMNRSNFTVKKQRNSWNMNEVEKILMIIENEKLESQFMMKVIKERENEETMNDSDFRKVMGWS